MHRSLCSPSQNKKKLKKKIKKTARNKIFRKSEISKISTKKGHHSVQLIQSVLFVPILNKLSCALFKNKWSHLFDYCYLFAYYAHVKTKFTNTIKQVNYWLTHFFKNWNKLFFTILRTNKIIPEHDRVYILVWIIISPQGLNMMVSIYFRIDYIIYTCVLGSFVKLHFRFTDWPSITWLGNSRPKK